jgi:EmrB/QacA subfamily drug resistance transporter
LAFLDSSVVNVALPAIDRELGGGLATQQWVTGAYLVTLGALILVAGSLSDLFGRKKVLIWGVLGFGAASVLCAFAPTATILITARALQGVFGALLVPSSLALIISSFSGPAQGKAIGTWTAWTGISFVIGPLVGGFLVDSFSWRYVFLINIIPMLITLYLVRQFSDSKDIEHQRRVDGVGAVLCTAGLAGIVYALIEQPHFGWVHPLIYGPLVIGTVSFIGFIWYEARAKDPMLPLSLFAIRNFTFGNLATVAIYAGLSVATFLITIFVQEIGHYTALLAGLTTLPVTIIMFFLSSRFGGLAGKYGPRLFMSVGPMVAALGFLLMLPMTAQFNYWTQLLPGILLFGLGLSITVAPLTSAVLADIDSRHAGIGSAVNNAIARIAGLIAIAAIGVIMSGALTLDGFHRSIIVMVGLLMTGGIISAIGIRNPTHKTSATH